MRERESFDTLVAKALSIIEEQFPWDLEAGLKENTDGGRSEELPPLLLDVREENEFSCAHIPNSLNVPRGLLEAACDYGFVETLPELVEARMRPVVVICRSGRRSALAAKTMRALGYSKVTSLKLGVRGWNDSEFPLIDGEGHRVDPSWAEKQLDPEITPEQLGSRD